MAKILIVEDSYGYFEEIKDGLEGRVDVLHAKTLEEGDVIEVNTETGTYVKRVDKE